MSSPVTRGELREELVRSEQRFEQKLATKQDLETWGGALLERMTVEIGRAVRAAMESVRFTVDAVNEPYRDLPARVARLEAKVFAPKRRRR